MTTDFAQLYLQLGIRNDCTLQEFKQACRRRIRQQHPDRTEDRTSPEATQAALAELLGLYAKALRFHRRHGRLPGGVPPAAAPVPTMSRVLHAAGPSHTPPIASSHPPAMATTAPAPRFVALRNPVLILAATIAAFTAFNAWNESNRVVEDPEATVATLPAATEAAPALAPLADATQTGEEPAPPTMITVGVDAATVRALQGNPLQSDESEWIYGPSWIRFQDERVVDWYSSPLRPLKTRTTSP